MGDELNFLKTEVTRLNGELEQASVEKVQAAKHGLALLEENRTLQSRLKELDSHYDTLKHEFELARKVNFNTTCSLLSLFILNYSGIILEYQFTHDKIPNNLLQLYFDCIL